MPRPSKGTRLHLRAARRDAAGNITHHATWIIRDGGRDVFTGCAANEVAKAEQHLKRYIADKYEPKRKVQDIDTIAIADVLSIFIDDRREAQANKVQFDRRMMRLNAWWGAKTLSEVTGEHCRAYQTARSNRGGARRDLEDLRAAINHHAKEGLHRGVVRVSLPPRGVPRDRWLNRSEAARLIWACWRAHEMQKRFRGADKGKTLPTDKRPLQHLARFILIGLYTGTRAGAIASASPIAAVGRSFVDLDRGIFYRLVEGKPQTNKRQPPVPLPPRLLAHMRRWKDRALITRHFVEFNGEAVTSVKTAFKRAVKLAGLPGKVSPHTLRHTAATWLMQAGADRWQAAGYLGMSVEMLERVYGHHHPDHLQNAVLAMGRGSARERNRDVSGAAAHRLLVFRSLLDVFLMSF
jgi:integrase